MKQVIRLFVLALLLLPVLAACSGGEVEQSSNGNPDGPVVQVYHPPT